jgi:competence protein ComEC
MVMKLPSHEYARRDSRVSGASNEEAVRWGLRQLPGLAVFASVSIGTCWDRFWPAEPRVYFAALAGAAIGWWRWQRPWRSSDDRGRHLLGGTGWVLLAVACSAAAWHHRHWHWYPADEIARFATSALQTPPLVSVRGQWDSCVRREVSELDGQVRILGSLKVAAVEDEGVWRTASGRLQVVIRRVAAGELELQPGDEVRVTGELRRVEGPANPGELDRQRYLRAARTLARLEVANAGCLRRLQPAGVGTPGWLYRWSDRADRTLRQHLGEAMHPVGAALLLGRREHLSSEQQDRFLRTGTVHLLAISGFHVSVLASGLLVVTRSGLVPERVGSLVVMVAVWWFAEVTGLQAPVMRANLLVQLGGLAWWLRRHAPPVNSLCWSAVVVWCRCPSDLFHAGAQLSFLAVAVLMHVQQRADSRGQDPLGRLLAASQSRPVRWARHSLMQLRAALWVNVLVWAFTLPLVVEQFHVVAWLAVLLNVVLWLPLVVALFSGFGLLLVHAWCPPVATPLAAVCRLSLMVFEGPIAWADQLPGTRLWHPGIGAGWVLLFYAIWAVYWVWPPWRHPRWPFVAFSLAVLALGIGVGAWERQLPRGQIRCTFLSVGHGACVVLQLPDGSTWLYDCGRMAAGRSAVDAVSRSLWSLRISRIDRVVVSHADADHYSLLPGLLERFRIAEVVTGPGFWSNQSASTRQLDSLLSKLRIARRTCRRRDRWSIDDATKVDVLHPVRHLPGESDNANSVVLLVRSGAQSVLLPGDLEGAGTVELLGEPVGAVAVVLAPHHGSCQEDPAAFLDWCRPRWLVVSGRWSVEAKACLEQSWCRAGTELLHTDRLGAIRVELDAKGVRLEHGGYDGSPANEERTLSW